MKIDRNNYEVWLLDYLEGRLNDQEKGMVYRFLEENPDCTIEIDDLEPWVLEKEQIVFPSKKGLKKQLPHSGSVPDDTDFDLFSIARMEGDLTKEQVVLHERLIKADPDKGKAWERVNRTRLTGVQMEFPGKEKLKHKKEGKGRILWIGLISTAAAVALLFLVISRFQTDSGTGQLAVSAEEPSSVLREEGPLGSPDQAPGNDLDQGHAEKPATVPVAKGKGNESRPAEKKPERSSGSSRSGTSAGGSNSPGSTGPEIRTGSPGMFSIQRNQDRPIPERVEEKPIRIASLGSSPSLGETEGHMLPVGAYDQIRPLNIPPATVHLSSLSITQLAGFDLQELLDAYTRENDLSLWSIANAGLKGFNRITGADASLMASRDTEGDVSGFKFKSRLLNISAPVGQAE